MGPIQHITLNTGHSRDSHRSEIRDDVIALLQNLLVRACEGEEVMIPYVGFYSLTAQCTGECLAASVYADHTNLLCSIVVAADPICAAELWPTMHRLVPLPLATDPTEIPDTPWCAVLLTEQCHQYPEAMEWLGDFERSLAWSYLTTEDDDD